nr:hypothetical protein [Mycobacterium tuberculosis]
MIDPVTNTVTGSHPPTATVQAGGRPAPSPAWSS